MKRDCDVVFYNKDKAKRDELLKLDVQEIKNYIHYLTKFNPYDNSKHRYYYFCFTNKETETTTDGGKN